MKKYILILLLAVLSSDLYCQQYVMDSQGYTLAGTIRKGKGYVTLRTYLRDGNETLDSVVMDKKGRFVFRGHTQYPVPALLTVNGLKSYRIYLEPSADIKVKINAKKDVPEFDNAPLTDKWYSVVTPERNEDNEVYLSRLENWTLNHPEDIFSPDIISSYLAYRWDYDELFKHLNVLKSDALKCYHYIHLREREHGLVNIYKGKTAPDIVLKDINGKYVSLKSVLNKNKYVLVDFRSYDCEYCADELPVLKSVYNDYSDKGFSVYTVVTDGSVEMWKRLIEEGGITWTSVSDLKKWEGKAVKDYMVKFLPDNVLLNSRGKIITRSLGNDSLRVVLSQLLDGEGFLVTGKIEGITDGNVQLELLKEDGQKQILNTRISNRVFVFSGKLDKPCMGILHLPVTDGDVSFFMYNDKIIVSGDKNKLENVSIKGSLVHDKFVNIADNCNRQKNPMQCLSDYVRDNPQSIYSPFIISNYLYPYMSEEDRAAAVNSLKGEACTMYQYYLLKQDADNNVKNKDILTDKAKDFVLKNLKGEDISLYAQLPYNDYTLVTFWASWDNISRNRNIDYVRLYNNYKKKNNLSIISVSLDDSKTAWENAVKEDGLGKWENVSDLKRWSSGVVRLYDLNAIPSNMLLDKHGNILGRNLTIDGIISIITNK